MSVQLLDRTRKISRLLHDNKSYVVIFNDICELLGKILDANVMVVSTKGKILGLYKSSDSDRETVNELLAENVGEVIDSSLNDRFINILSTKENGNLLTLGFDNETGEDYISVIMPVDFAGERLGTTFIYRSRYKYTSDDAGQRTKERIDNEFNVDDIILCEYANTVIELEMMRSIYEENEEEKRKTDNLHAALASLSASEKRAVSFVLDSLKGKRSGVIVASRIASEYGITRSIIVNAMQKLEGAGVLDVRSKGMKGTYISIINDAIYEILR